MFVSQPEIPVSLAVQFPFPAWATRRSEIGASPPTAANPTSAQPFAGLPTPDDDPPPF